MKININNPKKLFNKIIINNEIKITILKLLVFFDINILNSFDKVIVKFIKIIK